MNCLLLTFDMIWVSSLSHSVIHVDRIYNVNRNPFRHAQLDVEYRYIGLFVLCASCLRLVLYLDMVWSMDRIDRSIDRIFFRKMLLPARHSPVCSLCLFGNAFPAIWNQNNWSHLLILFWVVLLIHKPGARRDDWFTCLFGVGWMSLVGICASAKFKASSSTIDCVYWLRVC